MWSFYRYPKQRRPEFKVCADCAAKAFARETDPNSG